MYNSGPLQTKSGSKVCMLSRTSYLLNSHYFSLLGLRLRHWIRFGVPIESSLRTTVRYVDLF